MSSYEEQAVETSKPQDDRESTVLSLGEGDISKEGATVQLTELHQHSISSENVSRHEDVPGHVSGDLPGFVPGEIPSEAAGEVPSDVANCVSNDFSEERSQGTESCSPRHSWRKFLFSDNKDITFAFVAGLILFGLVFGYTYDLGRRILRCPDFSVNCHLTNYERWVNLNPAYTQGTVTVFYSISLAALCYSARGVAEPLIWPLLTKQTFSIAQIEAVLSTIRGNMPSTWFAYRSIRTFCTAAVLILASLLMLIPLSSGVVVGFVMERGNVTTQIESTYPVGGGVARLYAQSYPQTSVFSEALAAYTSWSTEMSMEPMPEYRDWLTDRSLLLGRGNFTAYAVRTQVDIACSGTKVAQLESNEKSVLMLSTRMASHNVYGRPKNSTDYAMLRTYPQAAVYALDYRFVHENKTEATIVFAALNGTVEQGLYTHIFKTASEYISSVSAVACTVGVEFIDDVLQVGDGGRSGTRRTTLSSISGMHVRLANSSSDRGDNPYNENALWLAMAPTLVAPSIDGTAPMFRSQANISRVGLPVAYTSSDRLKNSWTISEIENFIRVAVGAVAHSSARSFTEDHGAPVSLTTDTDNKKMYPQRVWMLWLPVGIILLVQAILAIMSHDLHTRLHLSLLRMGNLSEILKATQTESLLERTSREAYRSDIPSTLGRVLVMLEETNGPRRDSHSIMGLRMRPARVRNTFRY